jgi:hypothetical protein
MGAHVIAAANEQLGLSDREGGGWTTSRSVSSPDRSREKETNFKVRTHASSTPARSTVPRPGPAAAPVWPF